MSDFDDEPTKGPEATDDEWADEPVAPKKAKRSAPAADDDWDEDWDDEDGRGPRRDMTLIYAVVAAAIVIVLAVVLTRPKDDSTNNNASNGSATTQVSAPKDLQWQGPVGEAVGDVKKRIQAEKGIFIWTDFEGWHVRSNLSEPITVDVTADAILQKDAKGKTVGAPKTEVSQTLPAGDGSTGLDLDLGFSGNASFKLTSGGNDVPANEIKLGGKGQADQNPVTFTKA